MLEKLKALQAVIELTEHKVGLNLVNEIIADLESNSVRSVCCAAKGAEVLIGEGKTAITAARWNNDIMVIFERERGTGTIGEVPPSRFPGAAIKLDLVDGFYITIKNIEAYNALQKELKVVEQMLIAKRQAEADRVASAS